MRCQGVTKKRTKHMGTTYWPKKSGQNNSKRSLRAREEEHCFSRILFMRYRILFNISRGHWIFAKDAQSLARSIQCFPRLTLFRDSGVHHRFSTRKRSVAEREPLGIAARGRSLNDPVQDMVAVTSPNGKWLHALGHVHFDALSMASKGKFNVFFKTSETVLKILDI